VDDRHDGEARRARQAPRQLGDHHIGGQRQGDEQAGQRRQGGEALLGQQQVGGGENQGVAQEEERAQLRRRCHAPPGSKRRAAPPGTPKPSSPVKIYTKTGTCPAIRRRNDAVSTQWRIVPAGGRRPSAPLGGGVGEGIGIKANVLRLPSVSRPASPRRRRSAALQEWNSAREQSPSAGHGGDFVVDVAVAAAGFAERGASPAARRRPV